MANTAVLNHWWNVPLYVSATGLTTSLIPHPSGDSFQADLDFHAHRLEIVTSAGRRRSLPLESGPIAAFYAGATCGAVGSGYLIDACIQAQPSPRITSTARSRLPFTWAVLDLIDWARLPGARPRFFCVGQPKGVLAQRVDLGDVAGLDEVFSRGEVAAGRPRCRCR
jgi:hypothetical protein